MSNNNDNDNNNNRDKNITNVSVHSAYLMKFRLLSPLHLCTLAKVNIHEYYFKATITITITMTSKMAMTITITLLNSLNIPAI